MKIPQSSVLGFVLFSMLILIFLVFFSLFKFLVAFAYFIPLYSFVVSVILCPFLRVDPHSEASRNDYC